MPQRSIRWYDRSVLWVLLILTGILIGRTLPFAEPAQTDDTPVGVVPAKPTLAALPAVAPAPVAMAAIGDTSIPDVAAAVLPSVVNIYNTGAEGLGGGSGVIVRADGVIVTNNHVVEGARELKVRLHDGREYPAKAVGLDPKTDLAVLKLVGRLPEDLAVAQFGDSDALRIGEPVLAVGNPFGLSGSVTLGIVSALGRSGVEIVDYEDFIQTDAAINPGNSGGALVNSAGQVVGINTAILSRTGGSQGVGFAIPSSLVRPIMQSLLDTGRVERGWLGVYIGDLTPTMADHSKLRVPEGTSGVLVSSIVAGGPAEAGGLVAGDVIISVDGKVTETSSRLRNTVAHMPAGHPVELELFRHGQLMRVEIVLGVLPDQPERRSSMPWPQR